MKVLPALQCNQTTFDDGQLQVVEYTLDGLYHDPIDGCSLRTFYKNGQIRYEYYYTNGKRHKIHRTWYENGALKNIAYYQDDVLHNECGLAYQAFDAKGYVLRAVYCLNGVPHIKEDFEGWLNAKKAPYSGRHVVVDGVTYQLVPIKE